MKKIHYLTLLSVLTSFSAFGGNFPELDLLSLEGHPPHALFENVFQDKEQKLLDHLATLRFRGGYGNEGHFYDKPFTVGKAVEFVETLPQATPVEVIHKAFAIKTIIRNMPINSHERIKAKKFLIHTLTTLGGDFKSIGEQELINMLDETDRYDQDGISYDLRFETIRLLNFINPDKAFEVCNSNLKDVFWIAYEINPERTIARFLELLSDSTLDPSLKVSLLDKLLQHDENTYYEMVVTHLINMLTNETISDENLRKCFHLLTNSRFQPSVKNHIRIKIEALDESQKEKLGRIFEPGPHNNARLNMIQELIDLGIVTDTMVSFLCSILDEFPNFESGYHEHEKQQSISSYILILINLIDQNPSILSKLEPFLNARIFNQNQYKPTRRTMLIALEKIYKNDIPKMISIYETIYRAEQDNNNTDDYDFAEFRDSHENLWVPALRGLYTLNPDMWKDKAEEQYVKVSKKEGKTGFRSAHKQLADSYAQMWKVLGIEEYKEKAIAQYLYAIEHEKFNDLGNACDSLISLAPELKENVLAQLKSKHRFNSLSPLPEKYPEMMRELYPSVFEFYKNLREWDSCLDILREMLELGDSEHALQLADTHLKGAIHDYRIFNYLQLLEDLKIAPALLAQKYLTLLRDKNDWRSGRFTILEKLQSGLIKELSLSEIQEREISEEYAKLNTQKRLSGILGDDHKRLY